MGLGDKAKEAAIEHVKQKAARDILNGIREWRSNRILTAKRRWLFELIQNAIDTAKARKRGSLKIEINSNDNSIVFKHNGGYFTLDEISAVIYGGSTKPFAPESEYIGRFGTGFLVTHIISKKVTIKGYVKANGVQIHNCELDMNRESNEENEISKSIEACLAQLNKASPCQTDNTEFWTEFIYYPNDSLGEGAIDEGIKELKNNLPFIFAFNNIQEIKINGEKFTKENNIVYIKQDKENDVQVGILVENNEILSLENRPKIFIAMPLTETADYIDIPFAINSIKFDSTKERNALSSDSGKNNELLYYGFNLYYELLNEIIVLGSIKNLFKLVDLQLIPSDMVSQNPLWEDFNDYIKEIFKKIIEKTPLVNTLEEKKEIRNTIFPINTLHGAQVSENIFDNFYDLVSEIKKNIPPKNELDAWMCVAERLKEVDVFSEYISLYSIEDMKDELVRFVEKKGVSTFEDFKKEYSLPNSKQFLLSFFKIANELYQQEIINSKFLDHLLPNQTGIIGPLSWDGGELHKDKDLPEGLKDIIHKVGWKIRQELLDIHFLDYEIAKDLVHETMEVEKALEDIINNKDVQPDEEKIKKEQWEDDIIGWVELFRWCVENKKILRGFPTVTKDNKIQRIENLDNESFLIPFKYMGISEEFEDTYPDSKIIHNKYFETKDFKEFLKALREYKMFVTNLPLYNRNVSLGHTKLKSILDEDSEIFKVDHKIESSTDTISVLPFWSDVIGKISELEERGKLLFKFVVEYLISNDESWEKHLQVNCTCKKNHKIIPSQWLASLKTDAWVPFRTTENKEEKIVKRQATKESIENLFSSDELEELINSNPEKITKLLPHFDFDELDLKIKLQSIERGKPEELIRREVSILVDVTNIVPELSTLATRNIDAFKEAMEKLKEKLEKEPIIEDNRKIGENVEIIIKKIISDKDFEVRPIYKGGDLEMWPEEKEGWDSGLIEIAPYVLEIKCTSGTRVHLSKAQSEMAHKKKESYMVLVIESDSGLREQLKMDVKENSIPKDIISTVIENSYIIERIHTKLGSFPNPEEVEPDINGYWIKRKLWSDKNDVLKWIELKFGDGV